MNTKKNFSSNIKSLIESAIVKHESGELESAKLLYEQILKLRLDNEKEQEYLENQYHPTVLKKLGNLFEKEGKLDVAAEFYQKALKLKPDYSDCYYNLGNVFLQQGNFAAAVEFYQQALKIQPNDVETHYNLGCAYKLQQNLPAAIQSYQQALKLKPDFLDAYCNLGNTFYNQGNLEAAIETYQQALEIQPDLAPARFGILISQLPIIYSSCAEVEQKRNNYQQRLEELAENYKKANDKQLGKAAIAVGSVQPFYLAYQGYNDRYLQQTYGEMIVNIMSHRYPQWSQKLEIPELKPNEKIRIGFVSKFFYNHSNWKIPIKGWIENLDRSQFELFAYHTDFTRDKNTITAAQEFDKFTQGLWHLEQWCELIQKDNLHILIFPEFGMDPMTQQLGCLRLAPIQITSWGHPNTSGLPTIDYYLSSDLMEPENAREHYTEKLVRLPNLSIYYTPLTIETLTISKKEIGLNSEEIMFWCCQSLFKYLPEHDDVFPRIATELPNAKFVFIQRHSQQVNELFCQRLSRSFSEFGLCYQDYCLFLPPLKSSAFAGIASQADVFLDSIGWSGCNSTLESISYNTPVVTLPGELMRARHSMAILKMMGVEETIATSKEDYIKIAVGLGQDAQYRQHVSRLIAENKHKLYHDLTPIRELEDFLLTVVGKKRTSVVDEITENLRLAIQEQRDNNLEKAQLAYRQVLEIQPNHPEALYGLGVLAQQTGEIQLAEKFLTQAAQVQPDSVKILFTLGNLYQVQGKLPQAESTYKQAIALRPDGVSIYNNLGYNLQQQGKLDEAISCYQKALELQPNCSEAKANLGNVLHKQNKLSLEQKEYYASLNNQLGINRKNAGDFHNAVAYYQQAIAIKPDLVEAHNNLAEIQQQQGQLDDAIHSYQRAIEIQPSHAAYHNLAYIFDQKGKLAQAIEAYQQALKYENNPITHNNLGSIHKKIHQFDAAVESYQQAIKINPNVDYFYFNLGTVLCEQNKLDAAIEAFEQAVKLTPNNDLAKFGICFSQLPIIYQSVDEIELRRNQYQKHLLSLANSYNTANQEERASSAKAIGSLQPFYLAYQGLNDRALQQTYGEMLCKLMESRYPQWCQHEAEIPQLAANEKIRIGFVCKYFFKHSVWKIPMKGWVENLDRSEFELFGYHTGIERDEETIKAAKAFDKFTQGPLPLEKWAEIIQQDKLHILIFPEFGMDTATVPIGCLKLAPIQVAFGGHPETSGLPTIDYHLSSDLMEPENAQEHYTEQLVRLPNLAVHYTPLAIQPQPTSKREIGIADEEIMFWSCQSLFKYLPQHDDVFPLIAKELSNAKFVFIQHHSEFVTEIFRQRLKKAFGEFGLNYLDYCILLPRLSTKEFASTAAIADVFLDNIGWSGNNTAMESSAYDVPIVTYPLEMMRSRHAMAILKMMGIEETIASTKEDYVKIAVRLGRDTEYRRYISSLIAQNKHKLYNDLKPVRALEDFLLQVVGKTRKSLIPEIANTLQLAIQEQRNNNLDKAKLVYQQVLAMQSNHPEALYGLGMLAQQTGEIQLAEKFLTQAAQVQPDSVKILFTLGNFYQVQGKLPQAEVAYKQAIALRPDAVSIYNNLGYNLQQQGKLDEAITYYQKALEIQPNCSEAKVNLGNVLHSQGKLDSEEQAYYATLNNQLGINRKNAGDFNNAIAYYQQAIAIKPDFVEAEANLGYALHAQDKLSTAEQNYYGNLNRELGVARKKAGDLQSAVAYYRNSIALQSDLLEVHYELGITLEEQGNWQEAVTCYQKVVELNPTYAEVYFKLGKIYQQQKQFEQAGAFYKQGLKLVNPHYARAVSEEQNSSASFSVTPAIPQTQVTVGAYKFPGIPPVSDDQERPFWSVVITVYNRTDYILECLASLLAQWPGEKDMEILVMDNASDTCMVEIVNSIGQGVIKYYRNPENLGGTNNMNAGIALSRGQWIHILHDDDAVLPGFYAKLQHSLSNCTDKVGAAFTGFEYINEKSEVLSEQNCGYGEQKGIAQDWLQKIGVACLVMLPAVVIRRATFEQLGCYHPEITEVTDWEINKRIATFYDWWYEAGILARYRLHTQRQSHEYWHSWKQATAFRRAIEMSESYLPVEHCAEITAKARNNYFNVCLANLNKPLKIGDVSTAFRVIQETLKLDRSKQASATLFAWLTQDEFVTLREEMVSKLLSISVENT